MKFWLAASIIYGSALSWVAIILLLTVLYGSGWLFAICLYYPAIMWIVKRVPDVKRKHRYYTSWKA